MIGGRDVANEGDSVDFSNLPVVPSKPVELWFFGLKFAGHVTS